MRVATWNVNSLNARLARVEEWLDYARPDVVCLQETKVADAAFPAMSFAAQGYESASNGDGRWNGVAILSRVGLSEVQRGFGNQVDEQGSRLVSATCGGIRVHSVYVPNGRSVGSAHYDAKLVWLAELRHHLEQTMKEHESVVVAGDFNVAPEDRDVWDPKHFQGATHVTEPERRALRAVQDLGMVDAFRRVYEQQGLFTWWDYRAGNFHKHLGMRIDLLLLSSSLAKRVDYALVDRNARKGTAPSDHAPVFVDLSWDDA